MKRLLLEGRRLALAVLYLRYRLAVPVLAMGLLLPLSIQKILVGDGPTPQTLEQTVQLLRMILPICAIWCPAFALRDYVEGGTCEMARAYTGAYTRQWRLTAFCGVLYLAGLAALFFWIEKQFSDFSAEVAAEWRLQVLAAAVLLGLLYFLSYCFHSSMVAFLALVLYHCVAHVMAVLPSWLSLFPALGSAGEGTDISPAPDPAVRLVILTALAAVCWAGGWIEDKRYLAS
ncbi:hypothetical protein [Bittarella massiliensis (ex Durand et al. 2017)]|uniref:hypothetical protein n=1 Tax=Bittarella massiliensis (ex Durand et al. 2017) TaxID=1720313 RepID=UPI001AA0FE7C|nr:hypothetical protein [Bittarella massiliensis (ex Durand et al. 2017)]MBO1680546.1 hypothetical protein [Bittarella massiliensis (ex Durand et al. 2017)]